MALVGVLVLVASFVVDDALDGLLPESEWLTGPALGAFLAAFGIVGWMLERGVDAPRWSAASAGVVGGVVLGALTVRVARALMHSPTDPAPRTTDLVGAGGRVVTAVRAGGAGEVLVVRSGQPAKLMATAETELPVGTEVVVVAVHSPTKVVVQSAAAFWAPSRPADEGRNPPL